jgi:CubicO group peptidase (beta-lactamase class C family)
MKKFGLIGGALICGLVGAFASVASAQQAAPAAPQGGASGQQRNPAERAARLEQRFKEANKKGDGKLTLAEAEAGMPLVAKHFAEIDNNKKGYVTLDEIKAAMAASGR